MSEEKENILINVIGRPKSGKSTIVKYIASCLKSKAFDFQVEIDWGIDGEPKDSNELLIDRMQKIAQQSKIIIQDQQAPREGILEYSQRIEEQTAERIAKWLEQKTGVPVEDIENAWAAKLIRRGDWRRDTSMDD